MRVVTTPTVSYRQDAADPQPHRLMDHRIESWLDWHRHLPNIPYRYIAGLACMLDSVRMVLYRQHCLAGKLVVPAFGDDEVHGPHDLYDDHPEQDLLDVMLRLSASNTSSATICVARPKSITVSFKESKAAQYKHSNVTGTCEKRNVFLWASSPPFTLCSATMKLTRVVMTPFGTHIAGDTA